MAGVACHTLAEGQSVSLQDNGRRAKPATWLKARYKGQAWRSHAIPGIGRDRAVGPMEFRPEGVAVPKAYPRPKAG